MRGCLIVLTVALTLSDCQKRIPPEYEYPQGWVTAEHPTAQARSLSGTVLDPSGAPMRSVLVERMMPDFKKRLAATITNERGEFRLHGGAGKHYLRFRYRGFNDYLLPVVVAHSSRETLLVKLEISN
ncbi:MAG: carboxypeptidase-like regulatory domain-containing protein [Acidobacteriia bacterium]|nr:carboxypeptidase-like regulatory domain-containing protein [Terriglobia bacterium]